MSVEITVKLSEREAAAVLRSQCFTMGHGIRRSRDLQSAEAKLIGAISAAVEEER